MEFINASTRPTEVQSTAGTPGAAGNGFAQLTMYKERPVDGEISIEDFEKYALDRLRILKAIEEAKLRSKTEDVIQQEVRKHWEKHMQAGSKQAAHRKDLISHYILRLAYCRTADLRNWLLQQECLLFKYRFKHLYKSQQVEFFTSMGLPYHAISDDEAAELAEDLAAVFKATGDYGKVNAVANSHRTDTPRRLGGDYELSDEGWKQAAAMQQRERVLFYKVPFQLVPDLVGARRVLLKGGQAYVDEDQVYSLVVGSFRTCLSAALIEAARAWGEFTVAEADRLAPLVDSLPSRSVSNNGNRKVPVGEISAGQIQSLVAGRHFPLCMTVMYERLTNEHHLKHWGLQQFTLFMKAVGLPLEQALMFFRQQFSPRTSGEKFNKEYAYNIRYNYGQEGKRTDWTEWSCVKIINQEVGGACSAPCECNGGCPYKTYDANQLRTALSRLNCDDKVIREVIDKARGKHYQLACGLAFEGITGSPQETGINKPSEYYAASVELATQRAAAAANNQQQQAAGQQQQQQRGDAPPSTPLAAKAVTSTG
eukprot:GHUV01006471.1.p1 GENE.GHUV01006471.1~~GHUV01006471.1.p1  ORF type:complete len:539 (+),score=187.65 GHUV01006471.1:149-1765(+)